MRHLLPIQPPFSFAQSLAFLAAFPPCRGDFVIAPDAVTAAATFAGRAAAFTVRADGDAVVVEAPDHVDAAAVVRRATDWLGTGDDLRPLYAAAAGDAPFAGLVAELHGLHHVRFLTLEDIAVYCVMMQRTPIASAARQRRAFLERFGIPVAVGDRVLRAMPEFPALVELSGAEIGRAIGHAAKGAMIATVVREVAAIGQRFLRAAPYAEARDALLAIPGVGPFSAAAILLRGLGRMDELPAMHWFADDARTVYGAQFDERAILARYGRAIGYWSYYVKTAAGRRTRDHSRRSTRSASGIAGDRRANVRP